MRRYGIVLIGLGAVLGIVLVRTMVSRPRAPASPTRAPAVRPPASLKADQAAAARAEQASSRSRPHLKRLKEAMERLDRAEGGGEGAPDAYAELAKDLYDLVGIGGTDALPLVERLLAGPFVPPDLRESALRALQEHATLGGGFLLSRMLEKSEVSREARPMAVWALGRILGRLYPESLPPALLDAVRRAHDLCLKSDDAALRAAAVQGYFDVRNPSETREAAAFLRSVLARDASPEVAQAAGVALARKAAVMQEKAWLSDEMVQLVGGSADEFRRLAALNVLVATRTEAARATVLSLLGDSSPLIRRQAVSASGTLKLEGAVPALSALLAPDAADATTRRYVVRALGEIPVAGSAHSLLAAAAGDPDLALRREARQALERNDRVRDNALAPELVRCFESEADIRQKREWAALLARNGSDRAYGALIQAYHASSPEHKPELASYLLEFRMGGEFAATALPDLIRTELGAATLRALGKSDAALARREIEKWYIVGRGEGLLPRTRAAAIEVAAAAGGLEAVLLLEKIIEAEPDPDLRQTATDTRNALKEDHR